MNFGKLFNLFLLLISCLAFALILSGFAGCTAIDKLPAGSQIQSTTVGARFSIQPIDGTPLAIGSHTTIITTAQPPPSESGPALNRAEVKAPGIHIKSTVASGAVGDELRKAGGPAAIQLLVAPENAASLPAVSVPERPPE